MSVLSLRAGTEPQTKGVDVCQATVGKVTGVDKGRITVEYNGGVRELDSKLVKVVEGDYVLFSADIAIEKVEKDDAEEIMRGCGCA